VVVPPRTTKLVRRRRTVCAVRSPTLLLLLRLLKELVRHVDCASCDVEFSEVCVDERQVADI